jgi:hypothetical protein
MRRTRARATSFTTKREGQSASTGASPRPWDLFCARTASGGARCSGATPVQSAFVLFTFRACSAFYTAQTALKRRKSGRGLALRRQRPQVRILSGAPAFPPLLAVRTSLTLAEPRKNMRVQNRSARTMRVQRPSPTPATESSCAMTAVGRHGCRCGFQAKAHWQRRLRHLGAHELTSLHSGESLGLSGGRRQPKTDHGSVRWSWIRPRYRTCLDRSPSRARRHSNIVRCSRRA